MKTKILNYIKQNNLIEKGDKVCIGLSGGADSVFLFLMLKELESELSITVSAFHVNHNLRGQDALNDMEYVKDLCKKYDSKLYRFDHDVKAFAADNKLGSEEAGRILRRQDAFKCLSDGCTKIALAHHKNDLAETYLFNLSRGTSLKGLEGIKAKNGEFIRPLLDVTKSEIESYLDSIGVTWCVDKTNRENTYTRNYIRNELIPGMEKGVNKGAVLHIADAAADIASAMEVIDELKNDLIAKYVKEENDRYVLSFEIKKEKAFLVKEVILDIITKLAFSQKDISRNHIDSCLALLEKGTGKMIDLPYDIRVRSSYDCLIFEKVMESKTEDIIFEAEKTIKVNGKQIDSLYVDYPVDVNKEKNPYTKYFDYDKISDNSHFRTRKDGDYLIINQMGQRKKLKDFFIDNKVDAKLRDEVLLLATGSLVHWVVGYRMGDSAKITEDTKHIIKITVEK